MAYSATSADRFSLQADQADGQRRPLTPGTDGDPEDGPMGPASGRRAPIAGLIGLTITVLAAVMLVRRRRAGSQGERA
jgi:hypothetical protein